jgi:hypothetical protein
MKLYSVGVMAMAVGLFGCSSFNAQSQLTEDSFSTIRPGMKSEEVIRQLGAPTWTYRVRQEQMTVFNYRFDLNSCIIYSVSVLPNGIVHDVGPMQDPKCDRPD